MKKHGGFTLAETLVTLAVIGVVAAIVFPTLNNVRPNQDVLMFRKAFYLTARAVDEMINDKELYPENGVNQGFSNTDPAEYHGQRHDGAGKFCNLFAARLNLNSGKDCSQDVNLPEGNFTTTDGIAWSVPQYTFANNNPMAIVVDVNGDKAPNCALGANGCPNPDRFTINVDKWGRVEVEQDARPLLTERNITRSTEEILGLP